MRGTTTVFTLLGLALLAPTLGVAQEVNDWENPAVFAVNKEPPHATSFPYENRALALRRDRAGSAYFQSLNGNWKFHWVRKPADRPMDFYGEGYDDRSWAEIPVPDRAWRARPRSPSTPTWSPT